jgi:hypothetical protein
VTDPIVVNIVSKKMVSVEKLNDSAGSVSILSFLLQDNRSNNKAILVAESMILLALFTILTADYYCFKTLN